MLDTSKQIPQQLDFRTSLACSTPSHCSTGPEDRRCVDTAGFIDMCGPRFTPSSRNTADRYLHILAGLLHPKARSSTAWRARNVLHWRNGILNFFRTKVDFLDLCRIRPALRRRSSLKLADMLPCPNTQYLLKQKVDFHAYLSMQNIDFCHRLFLATTILRGCRDSQADPWAMLIEVLAASLQLQQVSRVSCIQCQV